MALTIERQKTACTVEFRMVANCRKEIQHLTVIRGGVPHAVGCNHRQLQGTGDAKRRLVPPLLFALVMPLQLDVDTAGTEDANQPLDRLAASFLTAAHQRRG